MKIEKFRDLCLTGGIMYTLLTVLSRLRFSQRKRLKGMRSFVGHVLLRPESCFIPVCLYSVPEAYHLLQVWRCGLCGYQIFSPANFHVHLHKQYYKSEKPLTLNETKCCSKEELIFAWRLSRPDYLSSSCKT